MKEAQGTGSFNLSINKKEELNPKNYPHGFRPKKVAILGSMPPLRALSSYCLELSLAVSGLSEVEFISFRKIYPPFLYPGRDLKDDNTYPRIHHPNLKVRRRLTWYNPLIWIFEGLLINADLLHAQWWSPPLALIYFTVCLGFKLRGKPVIFTVHNILQHEKSHIYDRISKIFFKMGDHFIVHSEANMVQLIKDFNISPDKTSVIPHGPLDFHVSNSIDRHTVRSEMGFDPKDKVILLFGAVFTPGTSNIIHAGNEDRETFIVPDDFSTIQDAINASVDGDTVLVRNGTYTGIGNRDIDYFGKAIVLKSMHGPEVTIIDCEGSESDPHRGFYFHNSERSDSIVNGFTIRNGWASNGGGIKTYRSSPTITNCIFSENSGTGIDLYHSLPILINCLFTNNSGVYGGGVRIDLYGCSGVEVISNCSFFDNSAEVGGGVCCIGSAQFFITNFKLLSL